MKTTFKKTMAALSAAAVVAASAAVMATPVSAAPSATLTAANVTVTMEELVANDYVVAVPITTEGLTEAWTTLQVCAELSDGLTYNDCYADCRCSMFAALPDNAPHVWIAAAWDETKTKIVSEFCTVEVKVTADAQPGDSFPIVLNNVSPSGDNGAFTSVNGDGTYTMANGSVTIAAEETQPETQAPSEAPATDAPTAAPTATATKAPAKSTSSPKTGDALPIAGVAAAVAVIGGVALVSKKRK